MKKILKRTLSMLLATAFAISLIAVTPAMAAGSLVLTVTPSKATVNVGEEITYTISMSDAAGTNLAALEFDVVLPAGLSLKTGSAKLDAGFKSATGMEGANFDEAPRFCITCYGENAYNGGPLTIGTFIGVVDAAGTQTVNLKVVDVIDVTFGNISTTVIPAVITAYQPLSSLSVSLTAPVLGATPQSTVSDTGYTGSVIWNGNPASFAPETVYTATITVDASVNYVFTDSFSPTVNGSLTGTVISRSDNQIVFSVTFPATGTKTDVSDKLTLRGLIATYTAAQKSINPATMSDNPGAVFSYTYEGTGNTVYPKSDTPPTDVGTYKATAKYENDTEIGIVTADLDIIAYTLTINNVTAINRTYDTTTNVALSGGTLSGVFAPDAGMVDFILGNGTISSADTGTGKAVETNIVLSGAKSSNYKLSQPANVTVSITKADLAYSADTVQSIKVGGGLEAITAAPSSATGVAGATVNGTVAWYSNAARTTDAANSDLSTLGVEATKELFWRFTPESTNYNTLEGSTVFTIVDGDPQPMAFTIPEAIIKTYGDAEFVNIASHTGDSTGKGAITYSSSDADVATVNASTGTVTIIGAGNTFITATAASVPGQWAETTESYTLTVNPAVPTIDDLVLDLPGTITYDNSAHPATANVKSGLTGFGAISSVNYNGEATAPVNAGTYTVTAEVAAGSNYTSATITLGAFTITPKALADSMLSIIGTYEYTGSEQTPLYTIEDTDGEITAADFTVTSLPAQTNAGTYKVILTGTRNYTGTATQDFVINKLAPATDNLTVVGIDTLTYDGGAHSATATAQSGKTGLGTVEVLYNGSQELPTDAGTYTVTANIAEGTNYAAVSALALGSIVINQQSVASIDKELFVRAGLARTYTFDLAQLLPIGVAADQVDEYCYEGFTGDVIIDGTPAVSGATLSIDILGSASVDDEAIVTISFASKNYIISNATVTLIAVDKTLVAISGVKVSSRSYNGSAISYDDTSLTFTDTLNGDAIDSLTPVYTWSSGDSAPVNVGNYSLTVTADGGADYAVTPFVIDFSITKAPLTLAADSKSISLNAAIPAFTFTVSGLFAPDTWDTISVSNPTLSSSTANAATAGSYQISITEGELDSIAGSNYELATYTNGTLTVTGGNTNDYYYDDYYTGNNTSNQSGNVTIIEDETPLAAIPFTDVVTDDWFYEDVEFVSSQGLMLGTGENKFSPNSKLTRAMIVVILYRNNDSPDVSGLDNPFNDVPEDMWFTDAIIWAAENGIVEGVGNGRFNPNGYITRQDLTVIFDRYADFAGIQLPEIREYQEFVDDADIADYAKEAVENFFKAEIVNGLPGNKFGPTGSATRAEVAAMLHRFITNAD